MARLLVAARPGPVLHTRPGHATGTEAERGNEASSATHVPPGRLDLLQQKRDQVAEFLQCHEVGEFVGHD